MKIKPILFSTPMVQANSAGIKTQTRRVIDEHHYGFLEWAFKDKKNLAEWIFRNAKYRMGDILYVRESFCVSNDMMRGKFLYKAKVEKESSLKLKYKPSIHMPREAARQFIKILSVRLERLQNISKTDAIAEGILPLTMSNAQMIEMGQQYFDYSKPAEIMNDGLDPVSSFKSLWQKINGKKIPWNENPIVWVYEYELCEKPINFLTT